MPDGELDLISRVYGAISPLYRDAVVKSVVQVNRIEHVTSIQSAYSVGKRVQLRSRIPLPVSWRGMIESEMRLETQHMMLDTFVHTEPEPLRDDLLRVTSHEIRTPLTVLKLRTQHLQRRQARQGLDDYVAILAQMEAQIRKLERLNADLLNVSNRQARSDTAWRLEDFFHQTYY